MALIPILKIKKFVDLLLAFIKVDYDNAVDKEDSFLFRVLGDEQDEGWNFYENAIEIFTRSGSDNRKLETRLMFDRSRAGMPTIHIREPAKNKGKTDSIGFLGDDYFINPDDSVSDTVRKSFSSKFELMITSGNSLECVMIQEVIESAMLASYETLTFPWFDLIDWTSRELMINDELERSGLFIRSIGLNIDYVKSNIPKLYTEKNITIIKFETPTLLES